MSRAKSKDRSLATMLMFGLIHDVDEFVQGVNGEIARGQRSSKWEGVVEHDAGQKYPSDVWIEVALQSESPRLRRAAMIPMLIGIPLVCMAIIVVTQVGLQAWYFYPAVVFWLCLALYVAIVVRRWMTMTLEATFDRSGNAIHWRLHAYGRVFRSGEVAARVIARTEESDSQQSPNIEIEIWAADKSTVIQAVDVTPPPAPCTSPHQESAAPSRPSEAQA